MDPSLFFWQRECSQNYGNKEISKGLKSNPGIVVEELLVPIRKDYGIEYMQESRRELGQECHPEWGSGLQLRTLEDMHFIKYFS